MRFSAAVRYAGALILILGSFACNKATPTEPGPVFELKSETFTGSLEPGGWAAFAFPVVNPGAITVTITQMSPISTLTMGLSLGSWDAATEMCVEQLTLSTATLSIPYSGNPSSAGNYCVAIFDAGNVQSAMEFTLTVTHY